MFSSKPEELHDKLNRNGIHQLENIITLQVSMHMAFNDLSLWFKPVNVCVTLLFYTLINSWYRTCLIHTPSIPGLVIAK